MTTVGWEKTKVGIYSGLTNLESSATQAGNRETCMLNLRGLRPPSSVFPIRHHGFSLAFLSSDSGAVEIVQGKET